MKLMVREQPSRASVFVIEPRTLTSTKLYRQLLNPKMLNISGGLPNGSRRMNPPYEDDKLPLLYSAINWQDWLESN